MWSYGIFHVYLRKQAWHFIITYQRQSDIVLALYILLYLSVSICPSIRSPISVISEGNFMKLFINVCHLDVVMHMNWKEMKGISWNLLQMCTALVWWGTWNGKNGGNFMKLTTNTCMYHLGLVMHMKWKKKMEGISWNLLQMCTALVWWCTWNEKKKKKKNGGNFMKLITYVYHLGLVMHMKWKKWREFLETYYKCVSLWSGDAHEMELEMYL